MRTLSLCSCGVPMQMKSRFLHPGLAAHGWEVPPKLAASARASLLMTPNREEWLIHQKAVLPLSKTWTGWRGTWWSSTRASAGSCTWGGTTPCTSTGLGLTSWRAALQRGTWECWWTTSWPWASSVPWLPRWPVGSWGALRGVCPVGRGRFSSLSTQP